MKVGKAIHNILSNDATVAALITDGSAVKCFPVQIPQLTQFPAIVYTVVSNFPNDTKTGRSEFDQVRVQIDCYARSYTAATELEDAVRNALDRVTPGTYGTVVVKGTRYLSTNETIEEDDNVYRVSTDYQIIIDPTQ